MDGIELKQSSDTEESIDAITRMTGRTRGKCFRGVLALSTLALASACLAQTQRGVEGAYPARPLRMIVPFGAGGGADLAARTFAQKLSDSFGQPVVVENRVGANGIIGAEALMKSAPDGYTLLLMDRGTLGINPSLYKKLPYDPLKDFEYTGIIANGLYVLVVNPALPIRTVADLVRMAKEKPGAINYASFGVGSLPHLDFEALKARFGINLTHVPYKGAALVLAAVYAREVDVAMSAGALAQIKEGRLRALAIGAKKRSQSLPEVPTMAEAGGGDDTLVSTFFGFCLPAGTPRAIIARLHEEFRRIGELPDVMQRVSNSGLDPATSTPEEMAEQVRQDIRHFARLVSAIGIQPE
ncbi:MAG: tripartite tricarboxylate transporter substrate binding protein [Betaproteobacteria bacterium]|nr:tripartite tricarboxylate transporter substrate binding protein [Betaproteobacteria bacterium]